MRIVRYRIVLTHGNKEIAENTSGGRVIRFKNTLKNNKGFSLIELMVVVAIIGILATIAVPKVSKFMAKARQTEVKGNLAAIYTANKAFFVEYNGYTTQFQVIGYSPEGELHYNVGFKDERDISDETATLVGFHGQRAGESMACGAAGNYCNDAAKCICLGEADDGELADSTADDSTFTASGSGVIVRDGEPDTWTIDQTKRLEQTNNGID